MDFEGYDALTLSEEEKELLKTLRRLSDTHKVEYGIAAKGSWISSYFTDHSPNSVHIPEEIRSLDGVSLYHSHTNETLLSVQDLKLLLKPRISRIVVISSDNSVCAAFVGNGYRPDEETFQNIAYQIYMETGVASFDNPAFEKLSIRERNTWAINERSYRLARYFEWTIEGGRL